MFDGFTCPESDSSVLVCTQVLGRGQDFPNVKYVINYDMPRAGNKGYSLTLLEESDYMAT